MYRNLFQLPRVGIVHFMAYPETISNGEAAIRSITAIAQDSFFSGIEITRIPDPATRKRAASILGQSGLTVGYACQPLILGSGSDLNNSDVGKRKKAVELVKGAIDEAYELGATAVGLVSGPDPGEAGREKAIGLLVESLLEVTSHAAPGGMTILLEVFDREIDKKRLIGSTADAVAVSRQVRRERPGFGLMIDLSHLPLQGESASESLAVAGEHLLHVHIGNCILKKGHPAYGDSHPRFGHPDGEIGTAELAAFLTALSRTGYLDGPEPGLIAFEVKPLPGEDSTTVIAGAKRTLAAAWSRNKELRKGA